MTWEMLAAVGQLAAVLVGIPSLIYLALQIRAQTKERRQAAVHALTEQWGAVAASVHDNPETASIYLRGVQSFTDLDPVAKLRFSAFFQRLFNIFEGMYFSHREGILNQSSWAAVERTLGDMIAYPGLQQWWQTRKHWHTDEFAGAVDARIARSEKPKAYANYDFSNILKPPAPE